MHAVQAVVLLAVATAASLPVTASFLIGPPGAGDYGAASLGSLRIDWLVGAFLLLAAVDHLALSGGRPRRWYEANVARGINPARWWEYSASAPPWSCSSRCSPGSVSCRPDRPVRRHSDDLLQAVQEQVNADRDEVDWRPFIYGCVIGAVPWIAITAQLIVSTTDGDGVPGFVVAIFITLFLLFDTFAVNMCCSTAAAAAGRTRHSPSASIVFLSLVAKSALAWQVDAGTLAGAEAGRRRHPAIGGCHHEPEGSTPAQRLEDRPDTGAAAIKRGGFDEAARRDGRPARQDRSMPRAVGLVSSRRSSRYCW